VTIGVSALRVNGFDLSDLGLAVGAWPGLLDIPTTSPEPQALPGRAGGVLTTVEVAVGTRDVTIRGTLIAASVAEARDRWHKIKARLDQGLVELVFGDEPTLRIHALLRSGEMVPYGHATSAGGGKVSLQFLCPDPYRESIEPTIVAIGSAPTPLPMGTAPVAPIIQLMGATDPILTYRDQAGEIRGQLALTVTLEANDYLDINGPTSGMTLVESGVRSNGIGALTAGTFLVLDARDGDLGTGAWPTLEVSSGTGIVLYRKRWL
jgi:predicted phage tail component-like protein